MSLFTNLDSPVLENGTGLSAASTYLSLSELENYLVNTNQESFIASLDIKGKNALLLRATSYVDNNYIFKGEKLSDTQGLELPRKEMDSIPHKIKVALSELCLLIQAGTLFSEPGQEINQVTESTVGPLTTKFSRQNNPLPKSSRPLNKLVFIKELLSEWAYPKGSFKLEISRG